jgi:hypothetical protein
MPTAHSNSFMHGNHHAPAPPPAAPQRFGPGAPQNYAFQYSACTGRRKALLIGINYFNQRGQLRGCINDVRNMSSYLVEHFAYKREDMVILVGSLVHDACKARSAMLAPRRPASAPVFC